MSCYCIRTSVVDDFLRILNLKFIAWVRNILSMFGLV